MRPTAGWHLVCGLDDVLPDAGVAALIAGRQIAIFRVGEQFYALDNYDPHSDAQVLARGLLGDLQGEAVVASPIYKQHFNLATGRCIEDPSQSVHAYPVRVRDRQVWVRSEPARPLARSRKLVVVGNGMAAMKVVERLLELAPAAYEIVVFGAEPHPNYNRILLSPVLAGDKRVADIILNPLEWYRERGVRLHLADPIVAIDRKHRRVRSARGIEESYDRLLLATGSKAIVLRVPGTELAGVVTFRNLEDVEVMLKAAHAGGKAVVVGGGLLGLEAAHGLAKQGMDVTIVHLFDTLMERQLDPAAATLLQRSLEERGLKFKMAAQTTALVAAAGTSRVASVHCADGSALDADLVVMAAGIRPNVELAAGAGLRCDRGILVSDTMQTFDPSIYAVGECVQHRDSTYGLLAPLIEQADVCASHLAELGTGRYRGSIVATQLKVTGIDVFSAGDFAGGPSSESLVLRDAKRGIYKRLTIEDNRVRGAVLYGDVTDGQWYFELMATRRDIGPVRDKLLFGAAFAER